MRDNLAKFFYDCGKLTFAVLVVGGFTRNPFNVRDFWWGVGFTLAILAVGVTIDLVTVKKEEI